MKPAKLTVTAANGTPFTVVLLRDGVSEGRPAANKYLDGKPLVEFYDARHVKGFTPDGQFIADYHVDSLLERDAVAGRTRISGLDLYGGEPSWTVDAMTMGRIRSWLLRLGNWTPARCPACGGTLRQWRDGEPDGDSTPRAACDDELCGFEY